MDVHGAVSFICLFAMIVASHRNTHVMATVPEACSGLPQTGPCKASIPKWFYNEAASECQRFIYGGCGGSRENRFDSRQACRTACEQPRQMPQGAGGGIWQKEPQLPETRMQAADAGGRTAVIVGSNVTFVCGSTRVNDISWVFYPQCPSAAVVQLFDSNANEQRMHAVVSGGRSSLSIADVRMSDAGRYECLEKQTTKSGGIFRLHIYPVASATACSAPPAVGRCQKATPMWYYDAAKAKCRRFMYGGCGVGDSDNRFETRPLCESTCVGRPQHQQPSANGHRKDEVQRSHAHNQFQKPARGMTTMPTTAPSQRSSRCRGPASPGVCRAALPAWYYDEAESSCKQFTYGGCGGNANRFGSRAECETTCTQ